MLLTEVEQAFELRPESPRRPPRHRRDACSMAWRCRFLAAQGPRRLLRGGPAGALTEVETGFRGRRRLASDARRRVRASTTVTKREIGPTRSSWKKKSELGRRPRSARLGWSGRGSGGTRLDGRSIKTNGRLASGRTKLRSIGSRPCLWKYGSNELRRRSKMSSIGWTRRLKKLCTRRCSVSRLRRSPITVLRFYAEQAIAPLLALQRLPVAEVVEEDEDEESVDAEEEYIRAEQQRLNDIVYAPFEPRFPDDDQEDEIVLRTVEPLVKRSRDPRCVSYGELFLRTTPKMVPVLTSIGDRYREKHLGKLPPLSCDTVIDGLRRRRTLALSSGLGRFRSSTSGRHAPRADGAADALVAHEDEEEAALPARSGRAPLPGAGPVSQKCGPSRRRGGASPRRGGARPTRAAGGRRRP